MLNGLHKGRSGFGFFLNGLNRDFLSRCFPLRRSAHKDSGPQPSREGPLSTQPRHTQAINCLHDGVPPGKTAGRLAALGGEVPEIELAPRRRR